MAIYHLSAQIIRRSDGRSSTAAAAYRAAEEVVDLRTGEIHDYKKKGGVLHKQIIMPKGSEWMPTRAELWNAVEAKNKRADAHVAREFVIALPDELNADQQRELAVAFVQELVDKYSIAADLCIHAPSADGDQRNAHGHVMTSTNVVEGYGFGNKQRELDMIAHTMSKADRDKHNGIDAVRLMWEEKCNEALEKAGRPERITRLSHQELGIEELPSVHLGPTATAMKRKGKKSKIEEREEAKRAAFEAELQQIEQKRNRDIEAIECELGELHSEKYSQELDDAVAQRDAEVRQLWEEQRWCVGVCEGTGATQAKQADHEGYFAWQPPDDPTRTVFLLPERRSDGKRAAFTEHTDRIRIHLSDDYSAVLAAVSRAAEKFPDGITLTGSDRFREQAERAARAIGAKINNPLHAPEPVPGSLPPLAKQQPQAAEAERRGRAITNLAKVNGISKSDAEEKLIAFEKNDLKEAEAVIEKWAEAPQEIIEKMAEEQREKMAEEARKNIAETNAAKPKENTRQRGRESGRDDYSPGM